MSIVSNEPRAISLDVYVDLFTASVVHSTLDLGGVLLHCVQHPVHGAVLLVNTAEDKQGVMSLA